MQKVKSDIHKIIENGQKYTVVTIQPTLLAQIIHYKEQEKTRDNILSRAEKIFLNSNTYNCFSEKVFDAFYKDSLQDIEGFLNIFETVKNYNLNANNFDKTNLEKLSPNEVNEFLTFTQSIDHSIYNQTLLSLPPEMISNAKQYDLNNQNIFETQQAVKDDFNTLINKVNDSTKPVLNINKVTGIAENKEVLFGVDGILKANEITTNIAEEAKNNQIDNIIKNNEQISTEDFEKQLETVVDTFNTPDTSGDNMPADVESLPATSDAGLNIDSSSNTSDLSEQILNEIIDEEKRNTGAGVDSPLQDESFSDASMQP